MLSSQQREVISHGISCNEQEFRYVEITRLSRDLRGRVQTALMAQVLGGSSPSCSNLAVFHPPEIGEALESGGVSDAHAGHHV